MYRQIKSQKDWDILQDDLNKLEAWEKKWGWPPIQTNVVPSEYTDPGTPISMDYSLKRNILDKENKEDYTKYLGVELQSSLSWNRHIDQTVKKANNMLGFLRRNLRVNKEQTKATAYCSMVRPLLEYCSTVWSPFTHEYVHKLEMVQRSKSQVRHYQVS